MLAADRQIRIRFRGMRLVGGGSWGRIFERVIV